MTLNGYISLRNHSPYSLLEGMISIPELIEHAKKHHMKALAIADTGHLFGALEFSLACQKSGIHPILGCQLSLLDPEDNTPYPVVLYAQNEEGYRNLCRLVTTSTVGQTGILRGHITLQQLSNSTEGLLLLTGGPYGIVDQLLEKNRQDRAKNMLVNLASLFQNRIYVEISRYEEASADALISVNRMQIEEILINWAYEFNHPIIATNQTFFLNAEDHEAHDILRCVALGRYVLEEDRPRCSPFHFFRSPKEMQILFQDIPEALANTFHLMKRCNFLLIKKTPVLPTFPCYRSEEDELKEQSQKGLAAKLFTNVYTLAETDEHNKLKIRYENQLAYECEMINRMGFAGYFLIVSDFIRWAKEHGIPVGPGRGSGAGSLVAWSLSITEIDPLRFGLFFERFLNPERVNMPDFDIDFCQDRRDEVITYVQEKYGADHVAHIITFGTLKPRAVLRDVGRVLQMPYGQIDKLCKLIPNNPNHPLNLQESIAAEPRLLELSQEDEQIKKLMTISIKLEGLYRHVSTHAAGVIISKEALYDLVPLYQDEDSSLPATEFSMKYVEDAGLVKFDFLGLKTLTVLQCAVNLLAERGIKIDLETLPLDDPNTFELLRRVETIGIFQFESKGMSDVLRQLQPDRFEDLIALGALYRPGPMDDIPRYIACRHGREEVTYPYPCLQEILKETHGVMVYQEQVMQIAQILAGYSLGEADLLRRAMGKKNKAEMHAQRKIFVDRTLAKQGGDEEKVILLFDQIAKFASYAFPKAHATPYGMISYQTAYMKANYPVEFMTALMIHDSYNTDKLRTFVREAKRMGIPILPPDINSSFVLFSVENGTSIRYGFSAIKNVGEAAMEKVVQERTTNGPFKDAFDFARRVDQMSVNKKHLESLIASGAFDSTNLNSCGDPRSQLMASIGNIIQYGACSSGAKLLFHMEDTKIMAKNVKPWSPYESLHHERQAIGFYLTAHPLDGYMNSSFVFYEELEKMALSKGQAFPMIGMVMEVTEKISKFGKKYAYLYLSDPTGNYEVTVFLDLLAESRALLSVGTALFVKVMGRLDAESIKLSAQEIRSLEEHTCDEIIELNIYSKKQLTAVHRCLLDAPKGSTIIKCKILVEEDGNLKLQAVLILPTRYRLTLELRSSLTALNERSADSAIG